ncbi:peptidoglycan-associated lipoprotein Pal [Hyphomonadaceae bacterium ML37]|nr:peptidoglycan-associated lipoprotein Pal [Hyphomonadaceae bacterium ML37]
MIRLTFAAVAALGLLASACASRPEPDPDPRPVERDIVTPDTRDVEPDGPTPGSTAHFEATAGDRVFYGYDRHDLTNEARETLRRQAAWLASYPNTRVLIAGNADERGTREYNLALGARRANAARDFLVAQGVDPSRIQTVSYGKERPTCRQSTEQCWSVNRNATTVIQAGAVS